jgi:hypothetical protein
MHAWMTWTCSMNCSWHETSRGNVCTQASCTSSVATGSTSPGTAAAGRIHRSRVNVVCGRQSALLRSRTVVGADNRHIAAASSVNNAGKDRRAISCGGIRIRVTARPHLCSVSPRLRRPVPKAAQTVAKRANSPRAETTNVYAVFVVSITS